MPLLVNIFDPAGCVGPRRLAAVVEFCGAVNATGMVTHRVPVNVVATETIWQEGERTDGLFYYGIQACEIWLAGQAEIGDARLVRTLAHEVAHYEQWQHGDEQSEADADRRADALCALAALWRRRRRA